MTLEMEGGKTKWKAGEEQLEEKIKRWSICLVDDHIVHVADFYRHIHLLPLDDGFVITSVDLKYFGIILVRFHFHFHNSGLIR